MKQLSQSYISLTRLRFGMERLPRQQQWRLRPRQVIGPVRIQDLAVHTDLIQEVVRHILCQGKLSIPKQTQLNEVAVPAIHLVETGLLRDGELALAKDMADNFLYEIR